MDPSSIWPEIAKMGSVALLMGIAIYWLAGRLKTAEEDLKKAQESRLSEIKETGNLYNQAIKQLETTTRLIDAIPKAIADSQGRVIDSVDEMRKEFETLRRELK